MHPHYNASMLNNAGVHMLESNHTIGAINAFQRALGKMKDYTDSLSTTTTTTATMMTHHRQENCNNVIANHRVDESHQSHSNYLDQSEHRHNMHSSPLSSTLPTHSTPHDTPLSSSSLSSTFHLSTKLDSLNQESEHYVYDHALLLPIVTSFRRNYYTNNSNINRDIDIATLRISATLLFNCAMSWHVHGIQQNETSAIRNAVKIYQLTLRLIHQVTSIVSDIFFTMITCLVLNNKAVIHYILCEYNICTHSMTYIHDIFMYKNYNNYNIHALALEFLCEKELSELKLNLIALKTPSAAHAA